MVKSGQIEPLQEFAVFFRVLGTWEEESMTKGSRVCFSGPQTCGRLKWMLLLLVLCFNPQPAYSQGLPGRLTGTVVDPTAAVVPGANVTLTNEATNAVLRTISGSQGFFVFAAVPAATYTLTIEKEGFAKWQRTGIEFHPGDAINIPDIVLKVGEVARDVTVTAWLMTGMNACMTAMLLCCDSCATGKHT